MLLPDYSTNKTFFTEIPKLVGALRAARTPPNPPPPPPNSLASPDLLIWIRQYFLGSLRIPVNVLIS